MSEKSVADKLRACAGSGDEFSHLTWRRSGPIQDNLWVMFSARNDQQLCENLAKAIEDEEAEMRGFCERVEEAAKNREHLDVFGVEYMPLPLDKNGEPWHVGDRIETYRYVMREVVSVGEESVVIINGRDDCELLAASHYAHKEPAVEDVLRELIDEACGDSSPDDETITKYAAKLRLKES